METITVQEFHARLKAQGVPREHLAFACPICGTVQSLTSIIRAGVTPEDAEKYVGFSCVGRFTGAGPHDRGKPAGRGCDWTLGGLFRLHKLEVDGQASFVVASPEQAKALMESHVSAVIGSST